MGGRYLFRTNRRFTSNIIEQHQRIMALLFLSFFFSFHYIQPIHSKDILSIHDEMYDIMVL